MVVTEVDDDDARVQFRDPAVLARRAAVGLQPGAEAEVELVAVDLDEGRIELRVVAS